MLQFPIVPRQQLKGEALVREVRQVGTRHSDVRSILLSETRRGRKERTQKRFPDAKPATEIEAAGCVLEG